MDNNEKQYIEKIDSLTDWCTNNNLSVNMRKTMEVILDHQGTRRGLTSVRLVRGHASALVKRKIQERTFTFVPSRVF